MFIEFVELSNFRKLKATRVGFSKDTTVFVGANNSGKTSAMVALRYFLVERERSNFSFNDFTLSHRPKIEAMGKAWEEAKEVDSELPTPDFSEVLPCLDVWLQADKSEAHFVQQIIPTLDWEGGRLGVRLRWEPKDPLQLQRDYLAAREQARQVEAADAQSQENEGSDTRQPVLIWPRNLPDFLQRRLTTLFTVESYILDPEKLAEPACGIAKPQLLSDEPVALESKPFRGLIRIDEISAQRGFGHADGMRDADDAGLAAGSAATKRMSEQLRRYWNRHLDPFESPDPKDVGALRAIEEAQQAFDARLRDGFAAALQEVEGLGYPGVTDPSLKISTRLKPVDGLNHEAAVQYVTKMDDGANTLELDLPEASNGLGYQNLISMVFRLMSFRDAWMRVGKASTTEGVGEALIPPLHLVLIEEPEAHLHTQVQQVFIRQAYKVLRKHPELGESADRKTQLIMSTHSSHIAHECDFDQLRYFRRLPATQNMVPVSCVVNLENVFGSDRETKRFVTRYLKVTHCDLFFADAVVFVEGPAERILVPFFVRKDPDLAVLNENYITWLEIGGSHAHRLRPLVQQLGLTTLIITDLDAKDADNKKAHPQRGAGLKTRNKTLETWCPQRDDFDTLLDLRSEDKVRVYEQQGFAVRVAYQCPVEIEFKGERNEALFNTLEDALVAENHLLFCGSDGTGLWAKFKTAIEDSADISQLTENIRKALDSGSKAEFALGLLELEEPKDLNPPSYIREGLLWLAGQLRERQRDLAGAPVENSPELEEAVGQ